MFLLVLIFIKCFRELIGLLSNYHNSVKQGKTGTGGRKLCERREDHSGMETDISETGNIGTKGETRQGGQGRTEGCWRCDRNRNRLWGQKV